MSPKTLATVFEYCLDQRGTQQGLVPHYGPSSELPLANDGRTLPIRSANAAGTPGDVSRDQQMAGKSIESEASRGQSHALSQQDTRKTLKDVLLVEDNYVNLKV